MRKILDKENINNELPGLILLSHGPMAIACKESAELICGEIENCAAYALEEGDDVEQFGPAVQEAIEAFPEDSVIMLDLFGGSPCNQMIKLMLQNPEKKLHVISGLNLPMLIEATVLRYSYSGDELIKNLQNVGKEGILSVAEKLKENLG